MLLGKKFPNPNQKCEVEKCSECFFDGCCLHNFCFFYSNGDLSKSLESITISQVNIPSVLAYASLLCPMFIQFLGSTNPAKNLACKPCNSPSGGKEEIQFEAKFSHIKFGNLPVERSVCQAVQKTVRNRPVLNGPR